MDKAKIHVSVVYAPTAEQWFCCDLLINEGATIADALVASEFFQLYTEWDLSTVSAGIYGHRRPLDTVLHENDRVEVYRVLKIDPRVNRKNRVNNVRDARKWRQLTKNNQK